MLNSFDLVDVITTPTSEFHKFLESPVITDTPHGRLLYQDNGGHVLAVAHMDFVLDQVCQWVDLQGGEKVYFSPALDDRLGAWAILTLAGHLGFDILFTDGEEQALSTAEYFKPDKEYNWIFSFDRAGFDCVMYQYHTENLARILDAHNFEVGRGSFSDICWLEHLGVKAFNFGIGYREQHTAYCHCVFENVIKQMEKFCVFYENTHTVKLIHEPVAPVSTRWGRAGAYEDDDLFEYRNGNVYMYHLEQFIDLTRLGAEEIEELELAEWNYLAERSRQC